MKSKETEISAYEDCLQTALKHYADAEWLGAHSPLAQPYFLGASPGASPNAAQRGAALQKAMLQAYAFLWDGAPPADRQSFLDQCRADRGKGGKYFALVLELRYLHRVIPACKPSIFCDDYLNISTPQYHRVLRQAAALLGENLLRCVHPRLQLERPSPPAGLYGRQADLDELLAALGSGNSLNLFGMSGMGKTSLSAALCQRWPAGVFFWYTLRPRLNDRLDSFLFALAFFLHGQGESDLWQQILADNGQVKNSEMAECLALRAVQHIVPALLVVIDDADLLLPVTFDAQNEEHARLLGFLERLGKSATALFVGQRAAMTDIRHIELNGIDSSALIAWFHAQGMDATADEALGLLHYTSGAPRLLTLCLALIQNGASAREITDNLKRSPGVGPLMGRLLNQMGAVERQILAELAVFRQSAPADAWLDQQSALKSLSGRGLVQLDLSGGVSLLPVWGDLVLSELDPETKAALHGWAAHIRSQRGEYTEAAYHYWQAGFPESAVRVWYANREYAIASGQAANAHAIFNAMPAHRLRKPEQRDLKLIRAELAHLNNEYEKGWRHLSDANWEPSRASVQAHELRGKILVALGDHPGALREYQAGLSDLDKLAALMRQQVRFHTFCSARFKDEGEYSQAWMEVKRARYQIEAFQGNLFHRQGKYMAAKESYLRALELADELGDNTCLARTYTNLGGLLSDHKPEEAFPYLRMALETWEKIGDRMEANFAKNNMVNAMLKSGRDQEALPLAQSAADFALGVHNRLLAADVTVNLSEIFFNLGNLDEALRWAEISLSQEQTVVIPYALNIIGLVDNARKNFARAESCFRQVIQDETSEPYIIACAWRGLGETYKAQGQAQAAREAFCKAIEFFEEQNMQKEAEKTRASFLGAIPVQQFAGEKSFQSAPGPAA